MTMDTASILMVAPRGRAREDISLGTSSSSAHRLLIGRVAELEQVPKALSAAGRAALKNAFTPHLPRTFTKPPYTTRI